MANEASRYARAQVLRDIVGQSLWTRGRRASLSPARGCARVALPQHEKGALPARALKETDVQSIDEPGTIVAVSPHLDDAVAGCGALLAGAPGSTVITVFAGVPEAAVPVTEWDRRCGFGDGQAAMKRRLAEDDKALHLLKAQPARLPFLDDRYVRAMGRTPPKVDKIAPAMQGILEKTGARTVLFPLGLFHPDHILASDAALTLFARKQDRRWVAYEDALYRTRPGLLQARLVQFYTRGICLTPVAFRNTNAHRKATAMAAYGSQMAGLGIIGNAGDTTAPERYWLLSESVKQAPESGSAPS